MSSERNHRHLERRAGPRRRFLEQRGNASAGEHRHDRVGMVATRRRGIENARQAGRIELVDVEQVAGHVRSFGDRSASTRPMMATASSISASETSSDGANRNALAVTPFTTTPASRHARATSTASYPGASSAASSRPGPSHRDDLRKRLEGSRQSGPRGACERRGVNRLHLGQHGDRGARGQRLTPERRRMIAGLECRRHLGAGPARADRHAVPERLRQGHDIGRDVRVLEAEPPTGAAQTGLHLVDDQQRFPLVAELPHAAQILDRRRLHAAFALNGFQQHRADPVVHRRLERREIGERDLAETRRQRCERLLLLGLAGRGERGQRAPVERAVRGDDVIPIGSSVRLAVAPRKLDRALVGFGTGVDEEAAPTAAEQAVERRRERCLVLGVEEVRHVQELRRLLRDRGRNRRMRVPERRDREPGEEVEVSTSFAVEQLGAATANELDREPAVGAHHVLGVERGHVVERGRSLCSASL